MEQLMSKKTLHVVKVIARGVDRGWKIFVLSKTDVPNLDMTTCYERVERRFLVWLKEALSSRSLQLAQLKSYTSFCSDWLIIHETVNRNLKRI